MERRCLTLWLDAAEIARVQALGLDPLAIPHPVETAWRECINRPADPLRDNLTYRTYPELTSELQDYAATYPAICRLYSIGTSVQATELWVFHVGDNSDTDEDEPE